MIVGVGNWRSGGEESDNWDVVEVKGVVGI